MTKELPHNESELVAQAVEIKALMADLSESFQKISQIVGDMQRSVGDPILIENLLLVRAGVAHSDTRLFAAAAEILNHNSALSKRVISPETMRVLAGISEEARSEAISVLIKGQTSDGDKLRDIESFARWVRIGDERTEASDRTVYLQTLAQASVARAIDKFQTLADEFIQAVHDFIYCYVPHDPSEGFEVYKDLESYAGAHRDLTTLASMVLAEFDATFGSLQMPNERHPERGLLANACRALRRFAEGRFGHNGGFGFDAGKNSLFSLELVDAIAFLGSHSPEELEQTTAHSGPTEHLRVLEFGAGAGGLAIGLMGGGFRHVGMFESVKKRARTLKKNWPDWPVSEKSITELSDVVLDRYRGVDLLAASIPCQPFARCKTPDDRLSESNHFPDTIRAIRIVQPRAFTLNVVETMTFAQHATYLAEVYADLTRMGYKVEQVRLVRKEFGLPQEGERLVVVGIRNSERGTFLKPTLVTPITRGVSEVLSQALIVHETPTNERSGIPRYSDQALYDEWARDWQRWYKDALLPGIPMSSSEDREGSLETLKAAGIDGSSYAAEPPAVGAVRDNHMRPRLTVAAIAAAQSFPRTWSFEAKQGGNVDMIAEALPPVLAKALALRVYAALTGLRIDLDAALAGPLIQEHMIGVKRPRLSPKYYTDGRVIKADKLLELEDHLDATQRAEARDRLISVIVPSKRGRGAALVKEEREAVLRIAARIRRSREEDLFHGDDGFTEQGA